MAISKNLVVSIKEDKAKLNEKMFIYRNDTGVDMYIELSNFKYSIGDEIVTGKLDVAYISAVFKNPSEEVFVKNNIPLVDGKIKFSFTKDDFYYIGLDMKKTYPNGEIEIEVESIKRRTHLWMKKRF